MVVSDISGRFGHDHVRDAKFDGGMLRIEVPTGDLTCLHGAHWLELGQGTECETLSVHHAPALWMLSYFFTVGGASDFPFDGLPTDCTSRAFARAPVLMRTCTSMGSSPTSAGTGGNGWALTTA